MSNHEEQTKKIIIGSLIGGIIGIGALSIYCISKKCHKKSSLQILGDTVSHVVSMIENCKDSAEHAVKDVEAKIHEKEHLISEVFELANVGFSLWKKISKGK